MSDYSVFYELLRHTNPLNSMAELTRISEQT